jgi:hypothetical protein
LGNPFVIKPIHSASMFPWGVSPCYTGALSSGVWVGHEFSIG